MTEETIVGKIRSSREHVKKELSGRATYEWWYGVLSLVLTAIGTLGAATMGIGGKPVAETAGYVVSSQETDPQQKASNGWRLVCIGAAAAVGTGYIFGKLHASSVSHSERGQALNAALKKLAIDLDDCERDRKEVTRDYQRLTEAYPEFVD